MQIEPKKIALKTLNGFGSLIYNSITFPRLFLRKHRCFDNILIISNDGLRHSVFALPLIDNVKAYFKRANLYLLTNNKSNTVFSNSDLFEEVYYSDSGDNYWSILKQLYSKKFDLAINLNHNPKNIFLYSYLPRAKRRIGYGINGLGFLLTDKGEWNKYVPEVINKLNLLKILNVPVDSPDVKKDFKLSLKKSELDKAKEFLKRYKISEKDNLIVFTLDSYARKLSQEKVVALCQDVLDNYDAKILFLSDSEDDVDVYNEIRSILDAKLRSRVINLVGKTSTEQLFGIISNSNLVIGCENDLNYIANAFDKKTVTVFDKDDLYRRRWKPFGDKKHKVVYSKNLDLDKVTSNMIYSKVKGLMKL